MGDHIVRGLLRDQDLLVVAATATDVAREARRRHGLASTSAQLLGDGLLAGCLLAALQKAEKTRVNLQVECDGPAKGLFVDADTFGRVRGYVKAKAVHFPGAPRFVAQQALGTSGYLSVLRDVEGVFYRGSVGIEHRDVSRDLENYFASSEQTDTTLQLEVLAEGDDELGWVGGVLVQRLPDGDGQALALIRERLLGGGLLEAVHGGARTPDGLIAALFGDARLTARSEQELAYWCPCTRDRVLRALQTLGPAELFEMIREEGKAEVDCDFCGQHYLVAKEELQSVLDMVDEADAQTEASQAAAAGRRETLH